MNVIFKKITAYRTHWPHPMACAIFVPRPRNEPVPPALEGGVPTTGPPGKSNGLFLGVEFIPGGSVVKKKKSSLPMQETLVSYLNWEDPLEKEMVTHSTILAWRISCTEEPGSLSPWGLKELDMT